jgi:hypothetical protein
MQRKYATCFQDGYCCVDCMPAGMWVCWMTVPLLQLLLLRLLTLRCTALKPMDPGAIAGWLAALNTLQTYADVQAVTHVSDGQAPGKSCMPLFALLCIHRYNSMLESSFVHAGYSNIQRCMPELL